MPQLSLLLSSYQQKQTKSNNIKNVLFSQTDVACTFFYQKKEHLSNQIETLENQLSQRSRITSARRSSRQGAKKVDGMRLRVSFLRRQLQEEEDVIEGVQKDLQTIETSSANVRLLVYNQ